MNSRQTSFQLIGLGFFATLLATCRVPGADVSPQFTYEKDIRPILKTHCFQCHGEGGVSEAGLDLRLRRLVLAGGDSGAALIPEKPAESLLLNRLKAGEMPPAEVKLRPTAAEITRIEQWISEGAIATYNEPDDIDPDHYFTPEERSYWAYQPVRRPTPPFSSSGELQSPIDNFVLSRLEAAGRSFSAEVDRAVLVRRLFYDLVGLPPTPSELEEFLKDGAPDAVERLLDRLFAQPGYGERWARHWLDSAGYADSEGYTDDDVIRPDAYKYRDYVIRSWNGDKPYDQFVREQLAGDELIGGSLKNIQPEEVDLLVATGFLRMAPDGTATRVAEENVARNEVIAKTIEIVSTSLLGLTVGCAQCHDHRYDPIPQSDYYAFRAIFEPSYDWKNWLRPGDRRVSLYTDEDRQRAAEIEQQAQELEAQRTAKQNEFIEQTLERELARLPEALRETVRIARNTSEKDRSEEQKTLLKQHPSVNVSAGSLYLYDSKAADTLKKMADDATAVRATKPVEQFVRALWEPVNRPPPRTYRFHRGEIEQPKEEVAPRELQILSPYGGGELLLDDPELPTTGRRLAYARWLTNGRHPLVSRVLVNRVWLHLFGRGIVPTPGNFGVLGVPPSHPELLDWLASELVEQQWSLKRLQRNVLLSRTYRQISSISNDVKSVDADNSLFGYQSLRRMEAEIVRDSLLAVSGQLSRKSFGPAVPVMADIVGQFVIGKENLNAGRPGDVIDMQGEQYRRTIYVQVRRSRPLSVLDPFDLPAMEPNCTVRSYTTVTPQSLFLMNGEFPMQAGLALARRLQSELPNDVAEQVRRAWAYVYGSTPNYAETFNARQFLAQQIGYFREHPRKEPAEDPKPKRNSVKVTAKDQVVEELPTPELEALAALCHALINSNRFLYVE